MHLYTTSTVAGMLLFGLARRRLAEFYEGPQSLAALFRSVAPALKQERGPLLDTTKESASQDEVFLARIRRIVHDIACGESFF